MVLVVATNADPPETPRKTTLLVAVVVVVVVVVWSGRGGVGDWGVCEGGGGVGVGWW